MDAAGGAAELWAALHAQGDVPAMPMALSSSVHDFGSRSSDGIHANAMADDSSEDEENDDDEEEDGEAAARRQGHAPLLLPQGGLPPSFYATAGLPDVVPSFMMAHLAKPYSDPSSSSEMFLDDILRSHEDTFSASLAQTAVGTTGSDVAASGRLTVERLSQLEDNYERKKKRAKINRRDLNSRFQELMDLLQLKEDRKLNRAKVLEKAVEHIHKLTAELKAVKAQLSSTPQQPPPLMPYHQPMPAYPGSRTPGLAMHGIQTQSLPLQQWGGGGPSQVMWMPLPPALPPRPPSRPSSASTTASSSRGGGRRTAKATVSTATTQTSPDRTPVELFRRPGLKRGRESDTEAAVHPALASTAHQVHSLLEFCDAWSLSRLLATCRELRAAAQRDSLWRRLCQRRWRLTDDDVAAATDAYAEWTRRHRIHSVPQCGQGVHTSSLQFAAGHKSGVGLWVSLVRRSNGRTTRTVLVDGRAAVRQVVELTVLVQNNHASASLRLLDQLHVGSSSGRFNLITAGSGGHLTPHLAAVNDVAVGSAGVAGVRLLHGDLCVLSVFVECEGLDLEQQFLERVSGVTLRCELAGSGGEEGVVVDVGASVDPQAQLHASSPSGVEKDVRKS